MKLVKAALIKTSLTKAPLIVSALIMGLVAAQAQAHNRHDNVVWARVVDAKPVYRWVDHRVPRESCWIETVATEVHGTDRAAGTLAGGIIGGVIGHAAGDTRRQKRVGTAVGAMIGAAVGNDIARKHERRPRVEYRDVERCEVKHVKRRSKELVGYDVVYRLHGDLYSVRTHKHPGRRIAVDMRHSQRKHYKKHKRHYH